MPVVPLRRNRDFVLLQAGQTLSAIGSQAASIAYPLLVLSVTHSPARAGVVGFASLVPSALFSVPFGVAADHWDRRRLMIGADVVRVLALGGLAAAIYAGGVAFWIIVVVAFVDGAAGTLFSIAQTAALR